RLCGADRAAIRLARDGAYHHVASHGFPPEHVEYMRGHPFAGDRTSIAGRVAPEAKSVHIKDARSHPALTLLQGRGVAAGRTLLGVPMLREGRLIGVLVLARADVQPFTDKQIELATCSNASCGRSKWVTRPTMPLNLSAGQRRSVARAPASV